MTDFVKIASSSLLSIGQNTITSFSEDNDPAIHANAIYLDIRDAVIRAGNWNFAKARAQPAKLSTAPAFEYSAQFQLPTDPYCLRVLEVLSGTSPVDFVIEGRKILTNTGAINLKYLARIEDPAQFDALFIEAYKARLSAELAFNIPGSRALAQDMWSLYQNKINEAWTINSQEGGGDQIEFEDLDGLQGDSLGKFYTG